MNEKEKQLLNQLSAPLVEASKDLMLPKKIVDNEKNYDEDYKFARKKLRELVKTGEDAIAEFIQIAIETKDPYTFKTLSDLIKTVGDLTNSIMDNAKSKSDIDKNLGNVSQPQLPSGKGVTQNNAIFVGNASDVIDLIKKQNEEIKDNLKIVEAIEDKDT